MAERTSVSWDWMPFEDNVPLSPVDEETGAMVLNTIDPRPPNSEVIQIETNISRLEAELCALRLQRTKVLDSRALIRSIPPEILARVFELGVHESNALVPTLSLVCKHWRQLTLSTPTLWSYVRLDHDWNYGRGAEWLRKVQTYMERAREAKILVDIDFRYCDSLTEARAFMLALQPHLERCFSFRVSVPDWDWMTIVADYAKNMHNVLEAIALRIDPGDSDEAAPVPLLTGTFPRLRSIVLEQTPLACVFSKATIPHLRRFHMVRDSRYHANQRIRIALREYLSALTTTQTLEDVQLQSAVFSLDGTEGMLKCTVQGAIMANVTDLAISFLDATNVSLLLDSVLFPSLVRLAVQMDAGPEGDNLLWLMNLSIAAREGRLPSLRHLELRACSTEGAALGPLIRALHGLEKIEKLGIAAPPSGTVGARLFECLEKCDEGGRWVLPRLRVINVSGCRDVSGHEILKVVRTRREAVRNGLNNGESGEAEVTMIRMVRIVPCYPLDPDVMEDLRRELDELRVVG